MTANKPTAQLNADEIRRHLPEKLRNMRIEALGITESTNSYAKGAFDGSPLLVVADGQTCGRGRLGRSFFSPAKSGLYMSLAIKLSTPADILTVAVAVAVCRVIDSISEKAAAIKWVNDIFLEGRKVCGILCEAVSVENGSPDTVVIGIGINLSTESFPEELNGIAGSLNTEVDRNLLTALICAELFGVLAQKKSVVLAEYKSRLFLLGKKISFTKDTKDCIGTVVGIDENAHLLVSCGGSVINLASGEVTLVSKNFTK